LSDNEARSARLVALDVDGTLVDYDERMTDAVRDAVRRVAALPDTHVVIATGRSLLGTLPVLSLLGLTEGAHAVCSNGAVTVRTSGSADGVPAYDIVDRVTFDARPAVELLRAELPGAMYAAEVPGVGFRVTGDFPADELVGEIRAVPFEQLTAEPVTRLVVRSPDHTPEHFLEMVSRIGLHGVNYAVGWTAWLDLAPEGVTKASGLEQVRRGLGVEPGGTYAVGDGRNDIEMIEWAAWGAVMDSAPTEVLAVADEVLPDVHHDGVLQLLSRL
jgi:hydroxymethylpyrimidine pyrophosphatase-like HAD family hydrolase